MNGVDALTPAIVFLAAGLAAALIARALRMSVVVGYLLAGLVIGPHGLRFVAENETTHFLAELGVVFLLFDIGLHFSVRELNKSRSDMLGLAPAQILLTGAVFAILARMIGCDWPVAIAIGLSLSLSSTAVVIRILADRNRPGCPVARSATAILVAQDILAIFLLAFAASLRGDPADLPIELAKAAAMALAAFATAVAAGRFVVRPVFQWLASTRHEEAFTALALLVVLAASAATGFAGLSLTLGAFLAGMTIADTPYRHIIQTEVKPFRSLLLGLFFIGVGMSLNLPALLAAWKLVAAATLVLLVVKTGLAYLAARMNGWSAPGGLQLSFLLSQGSEFTLVIIAALGVGVPSPWRGAIVASVALSFMIAPLWAALGERLARHLAATRKSPVASASSGSPETAHRVVVYGMTPEGRLVIDALRDFDISHIAMDHDVDRFVSAASDGYGVVFGDSSDVRLFENVSGADTSAVVLGLSRYDTSLDITDTIRQRFPNLERYVAAADEADAQRHRKLGMHAFVSRSEPYGVELVTDLLSHLGLDNERIAAWVRDQAERRGVFDDDSEEAPQEEAA